MLTGKKILLGITGSIAAYKSILLVRLLVKAGASVKVVMTPASCDFVTPLTLSTLSKNEVLVELFSEASWANHVMLGRWADVFIIAPLSCNTLAKMANGQCDNMLLATWLSATCPIVLAPAMDEDMWHHPATRINLQRLKEFGNQIVPVNSGELASGLNGEGRMAEPEELFSYLEKLLWSKMDLAGKKILVTAGPTYEALDPVRFIGNYSTGKMGIALCEELAARGAQVDLVLGPSTQKTIHSGISVHPVKSATEMFEICMKLFPNVDIAVMSAAVADYTPVNVASQKIKKQEAGFTLELTKTPDILQTLGQHKKKGQLLVGFALETNNEEANAKEKLKKKNADLIVLNSLKDAGAGFGGDTNKITLFTQNGEVLPFPVKSKQQVARDIVDKIVNMIS